MARRNLCIAFPDWSDAERRRVLIASFANLARGFAEFMTLDRLAREEIRGLAQVEGLDRLEAAREASKTGGVVVITAHFGAYEILSAIMATYGYAIAVVQRPRENPLVDRILTRWRSRGGAEHLPRGSAARAALRALREGKIVAMPLDQNCRREEGVFVPFFGRLACTRDGPARLAMHSGAPVLPIFIERIGESSRHRVRIGAPIELARPGDRELSGRYDLVRENVQRMTRAVEEAIRREPSQWIWLHRRWRTQPRGVPRSYPSRRRSRSKASSSHRRGR